MMTIAQKTIVITGASKGLGRAMALHCSQKHADVILVARTEALLQQAQEEIRVLTGSAPMILTCDISSERDVQRMVDSIHQKYQQIDVLINNAGVGIYRESESISNQEMRRQFEINFFGAYHCIKGLLPLIKQSDSGYIVNIGSLFSRVALAENSVYAATKFALAGFTEGLRRELKPSGIGVGLMLLGAMRTSFQQNRDNGMVSVPNRFVLDPHTVANVFRKHDPPEEAHRDSSGVDDAGPQTETSFRIGTDGRKKFL